ncbi:hypothetical protein [Bradyrhizobium uaiense]|uniref:Uncharacterized protein n=1 Tax=Bradyrhizobium uaiense TaxID=2594946 RepID=A0A6P1BSW7_9BRAD|nr:hypothetical protein [Bradyrhizobium uaiense]NEV01506.1 hypothetical protein [Bradyrhizobium uaiense]
MSAARSLDPRSEPSSHPDRIDVLEPLRRSLGDVRETADQFAQAQALLRAIDQFSRTYAEEREGAAAYLPHRDDRRLARARLLARVVRGLRKTVLTAKGGP